MRTNLIPFEFQRAITITSQPKIFNLERSKRIELSSSAWKAEVITIIRTPHKFSNKISFPYWYWGSLIWWAFRDLNPGPSDYESPALTSELKALDFIYTYVLIQKLSSH